MALMEWDDSYSVNIAIIDEQHKKLLSMVNELDKAIKEGGENVILGQLLMDLTSYTVEHFGVEENYFDQYKYPEAESHKAEHRILIDQVVLFSSEYESGHDFFTSELMEFLKEWVANHIKVSDKKYSQFLNDSGLT